MSGLSFPVRRKALLNSSHFATQQDADDLANYLVRNLKTTVDKLATKDRPMHRRKVWTEALWCCLNQLRSELPGQWTLYPKNKPSGGRVKGEYLVDFMLFDERIGSRVACESELGRTEKIDWAIDKLRGVKADIKLLFIERPFEEGTVPRDILKKLRNYLSVDGHHSEGEIFVVIQLSQNNIKAFSWRAEHRGPFDPEQVVFTPIRMAEST